ncbi:MAG: lipid A deacylase LpxR family protein [Chitinophagaceae bacterium]
MQKSGLQWCKCDKIRIFYDKILIASLHLPLYPARIWIMLRFHLRVVYLFFLCCAGLMASGQRVDHFSTFRTLETNHYFRFHYDNDYFTATDKYYTQGITVEYLSPVINRFLPARLLLKPFSSIPRYGISLNLFGYTPTSISSDAILYGDRPFDANLSLKIFLVQADSLHQQQLSSAISLGVMGPAALGKEIQTGIHRLTKNILPHGWEFQVSNDIILNYQLNYEKKLTGIRDYFLLNSVGELRLGTLDDKISTGFNFMAGRFNKRYQLAGKQKRKAAYYLFGQGRINFTAYDASLQGGLFNRSSPYTIPAKDITRVSFQADAGLILNFKKIFLSYTQSFLSKEFSSGKQHRWGGLSVGFSL